LALWVFFPLFFSELRCSLYRISKDLLGSARDEVHWLISLHERECLGNNVELVYVFLYSLGLVWMLINGFQIFSKKFSFAKKVTKGESKG
tara:strand:- start:108 stop:377 length:270 start_codon:yes stop_codon:yes gene_type:complete